jgi:hydrophobic/amphiphilic exporter-1 (mainly G- bacteria), HAE1 family
VRLTEAARERASQVGEMQIRTQQGTVQLAALGNLLEAQSPTSIQRVDRVRTVEVEAQIGQGTLTDAVGAVLTRMEELPLPPGYDWRITGEFENFGDAVGAIVVALLLAITLTYIVLAMILESFVHPFTIMLTLPLGAVGALLALFLWRVPMAVVTIGGVLLSAVFTLFLIPVIYAKLDRFAVAAPMRQQRESTYGSGFEPVPAD